MNTVVFTVCTRPAYFQQVMDAWEQVEGIHGWSFIFMVEPTPVTEVQARIINNWVARTKHRDVTVVRNSTRLGVLSNPHAGLSLAFSTGAPFVMLAEEDLQPHPDVLSYMAFCQHVYHDNNVLAACCNAPEVGKPAEVYTYPTFASWLWGTWADRWPLLSRTWDHDYSSGDAQHSGWDWNVHLRVLHSGDGWSCAYPGASLVANLGQHGGVHAQPGDFESTQTVGFDPSCRRASGWRVAL